MKSLQTALVLLLFFTFVIDAQATSYSPQIDFRNGDYWSGANYQGSYTGSQAGVDLTLFSSPSSSTMWWDSADGIGIRFSYEDDEIEAGEILGVSFAGGVQLSAIYISDLFVEDGYAEKGSYRINGGSWVDFDARSIPGSNRNGERLISFDPSQDVVRFVEFTAPGRIGNQDHEFALMGFDAVQTAVPEPSTALLLGAGLLMLAARGRRS